MSRNPVSTREHPCQTLNKYCYVITVFERAFLRIEKIFSRYIFHNDFPTSDPVHEIFYFFLCSKKRRFHAYFRPSAKDLLNGLVCGNVDDENKRKKILLSYRLREIHEIHFDKIL